MLSGAKRRVCGVRTRYRDKINLLRAIIGRRACVDGANAVMMSRPAKPARVNVSAWVFGVYIELFNLSMP